MFAHSAMVSATKYYVGVPDGKFFTPDFFDDSVVNAKKAYVTLNTLMGGATAEYDRFIEHKKQTPMLITPLGIEKMISLFEHLYAFALERTENVKKTLRTVRACRQTEVFDGKSITKPLTSTTKLTFNKIVELGYANKNNLALCNYVFHKGAVAIDMEQLGSDYPKKEEREVLVLMGNCLDSRYCGENPNYLGSDNKPAHMYSIDVYPSRHLITLTEDQLADCKAILFNEKTISDVQAYYFALNFEEYFPDAPNSYETWKEAFQQIVFHKIAEISEKATKVE